MNIMQYKNEFDNSVLESFQRFIKRFNANSLLRKANAVKKYGIDAYSVFAILLGLVFTQNNLYTLYKSSKEKIPFEKDVVYRFLNKPEVNWNALLLNLSVSIIPEVDKLTSVDRKTAVIFDDTPYYRNRSKKVELLSRCYDHSENRYYKGFELLTMGWSDGQTFMPIDFRLVANSDKNKLIEQSHIKEDRRTLATKRRIEATAEKPKLLLNMLDSLKERSINAKYVLFDSWFSSPSLILSVNKREYSVVSRLKNNKNFHYKHQNEMLSIGDIYKKNKKRRGRSRYLLSVAVEVCHKDFDKSIPAKIVYVRSTNNRKQWIALISTDTGLSEEEIIALYGKRWDIEPFHKVIKSQLRLTKEFQLRSYDGLVAHTTIVMIRYLHLSLQSRENKDGRSISEAFHMCVEELKDISFTQAFQIIIEIFKQCIVDYAYLTKEQIDCLVEDLFAYLPAYLKERLVFSSCES